MMPRSILGPPAEAPAVLGHRPQVLSWDAAGTWAQQRLVPYREEVAARFAHVDGDGLSFQLSCGLGPTSDLEGAGDLDNLLVPVIEALGRSRFVAAWGRKDIGATSTLAVGKPTKLGVDSLSSWTHAHVVTTASAGGDAWKQQIAAQVATVTPLPPTDAAALVIAMTVSPKRAWYNLWKPAIDALGSVLGIPGPRRWHPRDGRITELGLSLRTDEGLGWAIEIDYWWQSRPW